MYNNLLDYPYINSKTYIFQTIITLMGNIDMSKQILIFSQHI